MSILAIDFGTSRIKAAYWDEAKSEAVVLPLGKGGRLYVLSLFHVSKDGKIRFGDEAEVMLHHDPSGVVENLKLDLDKPIKYVPNGQQVKSAELMALLFIPNCNQIDLNIQSQPVKDRRPSGCSSIFFSPLAACAITAPRVSNT